MAKNQPSDTDQTSEMTEEARMVIGKARRSFGVSMSILVLGFMAIVLALVYRSTQDGKNELPRVGLERIVVPNGAEVISLVPNGDSFALTYVLEGRRALRIIDGSSGEIVREIEIVSE